MRRAAGFVVLVLLSSIAGCALIAGYDFGSYKARQGSGGSGGSTSSASGSGGVGGSSTTASASGGGGQGGGATAGTGTGGSGGGGVTDIILYSGGNAPTSIAIAGTKVYFSTDASGNAMGVIERRDKDGSNAKLLTSGLTAPSSLSVDGGFVYFATYDPTDTVGRVSSTAGGAPDWLVSDTSPVGGTMAFGSFLYWSRTDASEIRRAHLDGTNASAIVTTATSASLVAVDADGIYWLSVGTLNGNDSQIIRADLDGQNVHAMAMNQDFPIAITSDSTRVYWSTIHGGISSRVKTESTGPTVYQLPDVSLQTVDGIAAFGGTVYATEDTSLLSFPSAGGPVTPVRQGLDGPRYVAVDADSICYTTSSQAMHANLVVRIPR